MMIDLNSAIQSARNVEDLKPLMRLMVKAINTLNDARSEVRGDLVFHDGGPVLRGADGNYQRLTLTLSGSSPVVSFTSVGKNPTGE
jgi:hypothetical protein